MLRHLLSSGAILGLALAASTAATPLLAQSQAQPGAGGATPPFEVTQSVRSFLGTPVVNGRGEELGAVHDVLLTADGAPLSIVISIGGVIGIGSTLVALPIEEIRETGRDRVVVDATVEQLKSRPAFDYDEARIVVMSPFGYATLGETEPEGSRDAYLATWSERMTDLAADVEERTDTLAEETGSQLTESWKEVEKTWAKVRASTAENWAKTTEAFESAFVAFERTWESQDGAAGTDQAQ